MKTGLIAPIVVALVAVGLPATHALRYTVHNTAVPFFEAWQQCLAKGGSLASIELAVQNLAVTDQIQKSGASGAWWISGSDMGLEGSWIWMSRNTPVGYRSGYINFADGEPNNKAAGGENCLTMHKDGGWNDESCDNRNFYVCEYYSI
ncbi:pulmonary surfactant-associated protein D-like [Anopheles marshallii]|uniref:pulmonary surfactant-associated protein D-like n=1 Tax=Anopheles marshallii TaxID=1521116 RepID=UPI00237B33B0|nr:pulmonary surfactant-associated protein D-like [Anopheles marshallii]XP_053667976.1 pulmonary surfactant-associated protein D-like [Anopheles marshallii]XP_053667978.1 pulmonary surfactant-associated protein D-like [Anopheles marshallii]XP_053667981.1 pulmonary surfactant-associated protein D-like [Anopheles marshallii]XP_053667985.1 pulmonary surfactant-associated protein D-like [Anopheles marshallii]